MGLMAPAFDALRRPAAAQLSSFCTGHVTKPKNSGLVAHEGTDGEGTDKLAFCAFPVGSVCEAHWPPDYDAFSADSRGLGYGTLGTARRLAV